MIEIDHEKCRKYPSKNTKEKSNSMLLGKYSFKLNVYIFLGSFADFGKNGINYWKNPKLWVNNFQIFTTWTSTKSSMS